MIIQFYADSLGLPRPGIVTLNETYIQLFKTWLNNHYNEENYLIDRARGAATIDLLYDTFKQDEGYYAGIKDILIIHEGVCDCAPRPIPKWLRNLISKLPDFIRIKIVSFIHANRSKILRKGFIYYNTDLKQYEKQLNEWLNKAAKNFKRVYVFNIAPTNDETELHSPGFSDSIKKYNSVIKKVMDSLLYVNIHLIDIYSLLEGFDLNQYIIKEDGHHLTVLAHHLYAKQLIQFEMAELANNV